MTAFAAADFWVKARLFINRALDGDEMRSEDERRLWATLALEVLAKWALARHSPTLVADPEKGGGAELFKALGLKEGIPEVSITVTTAFKRCETLYRHFSAQEAGKFSAARNEYLHGTSIELLNLPGDAWWSRYWSLVAVLLTAHGTGFDELVGLSHVAEVEELLTKNAKRIEQRVKTSIEAARLALSTYENGMMLASEAARWEATRDQRAMLQYQAEVICPACGSYGTAESDTEDAEDRYWSGDPEEAPTLTVWFTPDYFSCPKCHLVLDEYELLEEAGLAEQRQIDAEDDWTDWEPEYGND